MIGIGAFLISTKEDKPNYKLYHNIGKWLLVFGSIMIALVLLKVIYDIYEAIKAASDVPAQMVNGGLNLPTNTGGQNAVIPPVNNGGRRQYSLANRMQNAQYRF